MSQQQQISIRKAGTHDVKAIKKLLDYYADKRALLPRSLLHITENIRDFFVAESADAVILGVCAFSVSLEELAEVKSLAVAPEAHNLGIASRLIDIGIKDLKALGIHRIFCLTYVPDFFQKLGFELITKESLPHKIWTDCMNCPYFPDCNEIALARDI